MSFQCLLDAHALCWHLAYPEKLGRKARVMLGEVEAGTAMAIVPAVVVAECLMIARKERIPPLTVARFRRAMAQFETSPNYHLSELTPKLVLQSNEIEGISDIFDRLIVTESIDRGLPLITKDLEIAASGATQIVWD